MQTVPCWERLQRGAAAGRKNVVFLTLGTGVGGGFLIDGKLFNGGLLGGTEFGHTVVQVGGVRCTCGREGCLAVLCLCYRSDPHGKRTDGEASATLCSGNSVMVIRAR